ncbi:MAG: hypothetical protein IT364_10005 [Candidatus Hydrogenedentes bacterium]|nr:hypothetical protein [Candidatus Hydrogenedentota bacterium]
MNKWQREVARRFDGESDVQPMAPSAEALAYEASLRQLREGAKLAAYRPEIADAQFPSFMEGIRESIEAPRRHHRGFWAVLSLSTAALLVALSAFLVFGGGPDKSVTTQVEAATTEIPGATVEKYTNEDGTAVVWVSTAQRDLL